MLLFTVFASSKSLYDTAFDKENTTPYFLMFSTTTCPHCVNAKPIFLRAGKLLEGIAVTQEVNVDTEIRFSSKLRINAVPAFYVFYKGVATKYDGIPNEKKFFAFVVEQLGKDIITMKKDIKESKDNMVVLFTRRFKAPSTICFASTKLANSGIKFGIINKASEIKPFGVKKIPSIAFFKNGEMTIYEGSTEPKPFVEAIKQHFDIKQEEKQNEL